MSQHSILIIDDEENLYDYLEFSLRDDDVKVYSSRTGQEALEIAKKVLPDLVLLDVMLPGMDGFEICKNMRSNLLLADIPVVMITALDDHDSRLYGFQVGVDEFLSKPVDQIELRTRIQTILRLNRYRKSLEERTFFAETLESKNKQLKDLAQHLIEIQETERRFVAAELHDYMGQMLTGLKLMIEMAESQTGDGLIKTLENAKKTITELSVRTRNLSLDLRPAMLDDFGLFAALEWLFERYSLQTKIKIIHQQRFTNDRRFTRAIETAAFRIIQESLTNVARYAHVDEVEVDIVVNDELQIRIIDHGRGFDMDVEKSGQSFPHSNGLSGMRERATLLGGSITITSQPGVGTTVQAIFNIKDYSL
ncbi:MAG: response regulator [Chloroflexota bacterium]